MSQRTSVFDLRAYVRALHSELIKLKRTLLFERARLNGIISGQRAEIEILKEQVRSQQAVIDRLGS